MDNNIGISGTELAEISQELLDECPHRDLLNDLLACVVDRNLMTRTVTVPRDALEEFEQRVGTRNAWRTMVEQFRERNVVFEIPLRTTRARATPITNPFPVSVENPAETPSLDNLPGQRVARTFDRLLNSQRASNIARVPEALRTGEVYSYLCQRRVSLSVFAQRVNEYAARRNSLSNNLLHFLRLDEDMLDCIEAERVRSSAERPLREVRGRVDAGLVAEQNLTMSEEDVRTFREYFIRANIGTQSSIGYMHYPIVEEEAQVVPRVLGQNEIVEAFRRGERGRRAVNAPTNAQRVANSREANGGSGSAKITKVPNKKTQPSTKPTVKSTKTGEFTLEY